MSDKTTLKVQCLCGTLSFITVPNEKMIFDVFNLITHRKAPSDRKLCEGSDDGKDSCRTTVLFLINGSVGPVLILCNKGW